MTIPPRTIAMHPLRYWRTLYLLSMILIAHDTWAAPAAALGYTPKYPSGFHHFEYVNPDAPQGGTFTMSGFGSFDRLNPFLLKGVAGAGVTELVLEPLMEQSLDEPYSVYARLAEDIALAPNKLSVTFRLNAKARFADGSPVTADDVKFSFDMLKSNQAHPQYRFYWADIKRAVVVDARTIRFEFGKVNPELHLIVAQMRVFARKWIGERPFEKVVSDRPLGSGPYVVAEYDLGKKIVFARNPNYWARSLGSARGMYNFERIVYKYYKDDTVQTEGLKAGEFDFMWVFNSKQWARDYRGPQFNSGAIKKVELKHSNNAGMQGFIFNTRRELFKDKRVRRAISLAFDFDWSNRNLFYNQYTRCDSYFSNSDLAARDLPRGAELALLEPHRQRLPAEVFTTVWRPPATATPEGLRENLRRAKKLLADAGWTMRDGVLRNAKGQALAFEIMLSQKGFERIVAPFARNLAILGIEARYRTVDVSLYQRRSDTFNFDVMVESMGQSQSPGNELLGLWHSSTADQEGSQNVIGIRDPVVDALIEKVIYAPDRTRLVTAVRALDRVLLHGEYLVPNWYIATHRVAYWDKFGFPAMLPRYYSADAWALRTWWRRAP